MNVLVDTPVWSYALRRNNQEFQKYVRELEQLILTGAALIIGPIRQELLSGYSNEKKFEELLKKLSYFDNEPILDVDYIEAAKFSNTCRKNGIQGSHIDFLICAVAARIDAGIFTTDKDFSFYQKHLPIKLHI